MTDATASRVGRQELSLEPFACLLRALHQKLTKAATQRHLLAGRQILKRLTSRTMYLLTLSKETSR